MQTLIVNSDLGYILPKDVIRGTVEIRLSELRTTFDLEVLNPGPESDQPPEARFSQNGVEVLVLIPHVTDVDALDQRQRALLSISEPMFDAGARVYGEAKQKLADGAFSVSSREIIKATGAEMGISRSYSTEGQISDDVATALGPLFV